MWKKRRVLWGAAAAAVVILAAGGVWYGVQRKVSAALDGAGRETAARGRTAFSSVALDGHVPQGFSWIGGAASGFVDAAFYGDRLFVLSSSELAEYDAGTGARTRRYRAGFELPSSPLLALQTGTPGDAKQPELLVLTQNAGYLAFDGKVWRQVRLDEKLLSMQVLSNGRVLLGSDRAGLLVHDAAKGITPLHDLLKNKRVTAIAGNDESDLWIGTLDDGLYRYRAGQLAAVTPVPDKRILCLEVDGARVWAGTPMGIAEFEDGRYKRELASGFFVKTLLADNAQNKLLAGTLADGIFEIPLQVRKPRRMADLSTSDGDIRKIFRGRGKAFILTPDRLLSGDQELLRADPTMLADGNIAALSPDDSGRLWVGYFDRGLDVVNVDGKTRHVEDDTIFCVNRIVQDPANQRTVVATGNGLAFLDAGATVKKVMHKADGLIANHTTDVLLRPDGGLTVATPAGVTFVEGGQTSSIYAFHGLVNNHVYALGDCRDHLLAGTLGGLSALEGGLVKASFTTANSALAHNWITAIAQAGSTCLVGTYGAGVMEFDAESGGWKTFPDLTQPGVRNFEVNPNAIAVSPRAAYAGTLGKGLAVWNRANGRWNWQREGLPSLNVTAVAVRNGIVYVGTDNGLVQVEEQVLVR